LTEEGIGHDVITDEDLHGDGMPLLSPYHVVLTGSHPEYWTTRMLTAMQDFLERGGRLMYLGGNGFYGVTSIDPDRPHVAEVRRGQAATRSWESRPGELHHATSGELGGLWRHRGTPPQRVVGVGFAAQGWDERAAGYVRTPASHDQRVAFAFEGIGDDEIIGDFGLIMGGAAGDEVDRVVPELGTPAHALVIATSQPLSEHYLSAVEQVPAMIPNVSGADNRELVHADMVFFETPQDGAVFSVGSISWLGSLSHNGYDNNVSRLTENVLRRFNSPGPLTP
jgi:N,N-dimethylformamidase